MNILLLRYVAYPGCQLDNLVLINKIKEQLMAEKIRPPHLPSTTVPSQQPLLVPATQTEGGQHGMPGPKAQQMGGGLHSHSPSQPDIALHARPAPTTSAGTHPGPSLLVQHSVSCPGPPLASLPSDR